MVEVREKRLEKVLRICRRNHWRLGEVARKEKAREKEAKLSTSNRKGGIHLTRLRRESLEEMGRAQVRDLARSKLKKRGTSLVLDSGAGELREPLGKVKRATRIRSHQSGRLLLQSVKENE